MPVFLKPDNIITARVGSETLTIKQKLIPNGARADKYICPYVKKGDLVKPNIKLGADGKPRGITIHNTGRVSTPAETNPAEQYARATYPNGNMKGVVVHYWVYKSEIWQQLSDNERGWHASDGANRRASHRAGQTIGGNADTIAIETIETGVDTETEKTAAMLTAYLLDKYGLSPKYDIYTHNDFLPTKDCPEYILSHWKSFVSKVTLYYDAIQDARKPAPASFAAGTLVAIKSGTQKYYPGGADVPAWVVTDYNHVVTKTASDGKAVVKGGKNCVLLGKKINRETGKEEPGINTWVDADVLELVK